MRLKTLKHQDPKKAVDILSTLTSRLLPNPGISQDNRYSEETTKVLHEIYAKLNVRGAEHSKEEVAKIYNFLAEEMRKLAFENKQENNIKAIMGQRGDLRPGDYEIKFSTSFDNFPKRLGIRRSYVEEVLRHPDSFEHLFPEVLGLEVDNAFSLYIKNYFDAKDPFSLLVNTGRKGNVLIVRAAWKIYHADVDLSRAHNLSEVLRIFVDKYGRLIKIGNKVAKLIVYEKIEIKEDNDKILLCETMDQDPGKENFSNIIFRRQSGSNVLEVGLAYVISISKYLVDLRKHGLVEEPNVGAYQFENSIPQVACNN